jgi:hypothetical protein
LAIVAVIIDFAGDRNAEMPLARITSGALSVTFTFAIFTTELAIDAAVAGLRLLNFIHGDADIFSRRFNRLVGAACEHEAEAG